MYTQVDDLHFNGVHYSIVAISQKGPDKDVNQDFYGIYHDDNQILICVADGLGSAPKSAEGSSNVVSAAIELLKNPIMLDDFSYKLFSEWKSRLSGNIEDYDTTCKFLKITRDVLYSGGVGDGWILLDLGNVFEKYFLEKTFSNQTSSMLSFDLHKDFKINCAKSSDLCAAMVSTDGFSDDFQESSAESLMNEISEEIRSDPKKYSIYLKELLSNWPIRSNADDKTVVFIVKMGD